MNVVRVMTLNGQKVAQTVTVKLRPGFGISHDGQHIEGGPHTLPADIAWSLISTNRADIVEAGVEPIEQRDPDVENRDPAVRSARKR